MEVIVNRKWPKPTYTIGTLSIDGVRICEVLEDADRGLVQGMSAAEITKRKVYGRTAIPKGRYQVKLTWSNKFHGRSWAKPYGGKAPELLNVPGYEGVRIHPGNSDADTLGCILPGRNTVVGKVTDSQATYKKIMDKYLIPATKRGEEIYITIV